MSEKVFSEYIAKDFSEPLAQGDVFQWKENQDPWQQLGIVITADCDLAHGKFGNHLSYCPILKFHDFLSLFWVSNDLLKWQQTHGERVAINLSKARSIARPEFTEPIKCDVLLRWLDRRKVLGVLEDAGIQQGKDSQKLETDLNLILELIDSTKSNDIKLKLNVIAKARLPKIPTKNEDIIASVRSLWKSYGEKLNKLQGDLFFLNELSPSHKEGYIVYLRRIAEIIPDHIAINTFMQPKSKATRISQLRATFRYRITQKLAAVFTDIGLPDEYESLCTDTISTIALKLGI